MIHCKPTGISRQNINSEIICEWCNGSGEGQSGSYSSPEDQSQRYASPCGSAPRICPRCHGRGGWPDGDAPEYQEWFPSLSDEDVFKIIETLIF